MEGAITAPVRKSVSVPLQPDAAFKLFTEGIAGWWPLETHSIAGDKAQACVFEGFAGGRIYEVSEDGTEGEWGRVLIWEPPIRVVYSWNPNPNRTAETEVEVTFAPDGDGTRLTLEHRRWENLGDDGAELRMSYETGWDPVLEAFVRTATNG